ncbi:F0F1 ATP synthase subunit B [Jannaschia donghaensis]|uniref:ATP synthase subunit b n=1 Tax=Jannaschia donghaensis TaxID=420998 RepID=A0A0M6YE75_9RHOB|nr:F0F1 ATP synthase subunit B [Jannaschia donghaensis]CTQ48280.1 F-type ATPase subunit b [Jannaschia donghaensis]
MRLILPAFLLTATPALAATGPFFSLSNTDFVVTLGFLVFIGILLYFKVPTLLTKQLDARAEGIQSDLNEAKALRDEAQALFASYERKTREAQAQADDIVAAAKSDATAAADQARADLEVSVTRRLAAAEDQIGSAQNAAVREVRDTAITVAIAAAGEVVAKQMTADEANAMIDASIEQVAAKLH